MNFNDNYLNHSFEIVNELTTWTDGKCKICGIFAYYSKILKVYFRLPTSSSSELKLRCEEMLIKNLLE